MANAGVGGEGERGGAHETDVVVVLGVEVVNGFDDVVGDVDGAEGVEDEGAGERREGSTEIKEDEGRVGVEGGGGEGKRFNVENVEEEVSTRDEAALVGVGPGGGVTVEFVGQDCGEEFGVGVGTR